MKIKNIIIWVVLSFLFGTSVVFSGISYYKQYTTSKELAEIKEKLEDVYENNEKGITKKTVYVEESSIIETVKKVQDSVVNIVATKDIIKYKRTPFFYDNFFNEPFFNDFFGNRFNQNEQKEKSEDEEEPIERVKVGGGSGFIYSEDGLILTNKHVVSDENAEYTVILFDGTEFEAEVLARDSFNDIAVVKAKPKDGEKMPKFKPLKLGESSSLQVGQRVVAIGNALAEFENTVTTGIISAKGRSIIASDGRYSGEKIQNLIQTDAAINPGNSGGPLVNLVGEVVGMNTAIAQGAESIGFAIPADDLRSVAESVENHGRIVRPFIGVRYMMITEEVAKSLNLDREEGALLITDAQRGIPAVVKDSPADKAGLKANDIILEIDGEKLILENDLRSLISEKNIDDTLKLRVLRDCEELEIKVKLEEFKENKEK